MIAEARAETLRRKIRGLDALSSNAGAFPAESRAAKLRADVLRAELRRLGLAPPVTTEQASPPPVCAPACSGFAETPARDDLATMKQAALMMALGVCFLLASMLLHALHG